MSLYCVECSKITNKNSIEIKREIDGKINLQFYCMGSGFKNFSTIDREEQTDVLEIL